MQAMPQECPGRIWIIIAFWFLVCSFVTGRILDRTNVTG